MKTYPLHDTAYSLSGDKIHIDLIMTATDGFGLALYSLDENTTIHIEANRQPLPLQELKLGFIGQDNPKNRRSATINKNLYKHLPSTEINA